MTGGIMFKFGKTIKVIELNGGHEFVILCGKNGAFLRSDEDFETFTFDYVKGDDEYCYLYNVSPDNVETAIWEWLSTLSRYTNPEHERVLGSMRLSRVEAA